MYIGLIFVSVNFASQKCGAQDIYGPPTIPLHDCTIVFLLYPFNQDGDQVTNKKKLLRADRPPK